MSLPLRRYWFPMKRITASLLCILLWCMPLITDAQYSIGTWRDHLPYGQTIDVCVDKMDIVYCATPYSMFAYNQADGEIQRISKTNLLSDVGLTCIEYDSELDVILVGYENGNLDLIFGGATSYNIPDIKMSSLLGDKKIYDIFPYNGLAYLSTGFGIVVVDVGRREVRSTYVIGNNGAQQRVNDLHIVGNAIYAATPEGIKVADVTNNFLSNFQNWSTLDGVPVGEVSDIEYYLGYLFIQVEGETKDIIWRRSEEGGDWSVFADFESLKYNRIWSDGLWMCFAGNGVYQTVHTDLVININEVNHAGNPVNANNAIMNRWGECWVADNNNGLLVRRSDGVKEIIRPGGPAKADTRRIDSYNDNLWIAHGGINPAGGNFWNKYPVSGFVNEQWIIADPGMGVNQTLGVNDILDVAVDPINNAHVYFGSWDEGIVERTTSGSFQFYNESTNNSTLKGGNLSWAPGWTGVSGVDVDMSGVLWCTNSNSDRHVHARDQAGNFYSFSLSPALSSGGERMGDIMMTQLGYVWTIVPNKGIVVLKTNGTLGSQSDDSFRQLTNEEGNGGLPTNDVLCLAEDLDSEIWVGTLQGLVVFYNQDAIFEEDFFDGEPILITQDGNVQKLLETEAVSCIAIDGGNRKWIGTQNSGVYLFSPDGLREIYHFTDKNSPLFSNNIYDISINQKNGEVFFATEKGIVSFFSTATNFDATMENVRAFPNPVRPEYEGNITVDGLAYNSNVKITDVQGNLVFETQSEGGRAVWNGRLLNGERPATGIYYVFAANEDGTEDNVAKIAFIR